MKDIEFNTQMWQLFLQIIDKSNLDAKGELIKDYKENFKSAFRKAYNITSLYNSLKAQLEISDIKGDS